jgi:uncharacterized protein YbbC (DUF1343 family)
MPFKLNIVKILTWIVIMNTITMPLSARVYTGLEVFLHKYTNLVKGKRVGLITNPTGVNAKLTSTVDLLKADPRVNLVALFAPEHGIRGNVRAGENVAGGKDSKTGLPVYTLYGANGHRPSKAALAKVDVLIYDIQDVGSRAYTYIWHLAECMSAAKDAGKSVIVLDRPNPLGANVVDGPVTERKYLSFIGLYPIPRVYGMTVGELARYLKGEERINCNLTVVPMWNYKRGMSWEQTGLPWVPTSPHIPTPEAACCFACTGTIGELGIINIGIGYTLPFQCIAAPWIDAEFTSRSLNSMKLPGVVFRPIYYKPFYAAYKDKNISGVQIHVINPAVFKPTTTEVAILTHLKKHYPRDFRILADKIKMFDKAMGTATVRQEISAGWNYQQIATKWQPEVNRFRLKRRKYLIYKDN